MKKKSLITTGSIIAVIIAIFFINWKKPVSKEDMQTTIAEGFKTKWGFSVSEVSLIKTDDYTYTGYAVLDTDKSQAELSVTIDRDNPQEYMWTCTKASPIMVQDKLEKELAKFDSTPYLDSMQRVGDSALKELAK